MRGRSRRELGHDPVPDETTILRFRHLLAPGNVPSVASNCTDASKAAHRLAIVDRVLEVVPL